MKVDKKSLPADSTTQSRKPPQNPKDAPTTEAKKTDQKVKVEKLAKRAAVESLPPIDNQAVEVNFSMREPTAEEAAQRSTYSPEEVRAKAKLMLDDPRMNPKERQVLNEIFAKEEMANRAANPKKR